MPIYKYTPQMMQVGCDTDTAGLPHERSNLVLCLIFPISLFIAGPRMHRNLLRGPMENGQTLKCKLEVCIDGTVWGNPLLPDANRSCPVAVNGDEKSRLNALLSLFVVYLCLYTVSYLYV